ncbi:hypothetical protein BU26DRAFT_511403 [Trematosphaeria pertusa]|uniref:Uncharacterized protein n=1 Tax=Trematosphaeria pertusa TaxID=390896 RepID=A0A6A6HUM9_9PLEO|nr:uncharacterized protein BU26DRAFT_511403 [Trematosphaeria pertusa]KAF2241629.1 hypothetical protein BU26DRAFT_511403 [Trematosphaeria pertusa]
MSEGIGVQNASRRFPGNDKISVAPRPPRSSSAVALADCITGDQKPSPSPDRVERRELQHIDAAPGRHRTTLARRSATRRWAASPPDLPEFSGTLLINQAALQAQAYTARLQARSSPHPAPAPTNEPEPAATDPRRLSERSEEFKHPSRTLTSLLRDCFRDMLCGEK